MNPDDEANRTKKHDNQQQHEHRNIRHNHVGDTSVSGSITVYDNSYLPKIVITNYSDFDLVLSSIITVNGDLGTPTCSVTGGS